jgi:hypothetical protein
MNKLVSSESGFAFSCLISFLVKKFWISSLILYVSRFPRPSLFEIFWFNETLIDEINILNLSFVEALG